MKKIITILLISVVLIIEITLHSCGRKGPDAPPDTTPPAVSSTSPANGAVDVPLNAVLTITFSEDMDPSTVNEQTVTLVTSAGDTIVPGTVTLTGATAFFRPSANLKSNSQHKLTISGGVKDTSGNPLTQPYYFVFTTGTSLETRPQIIHFEPTGTAVSINTAISVTFNEAMNASTVNPSTFKVSAGSSPITPESVTMDNSNTKANFVLKSALSFDTQYTATIAADRPGAPGVEDMAGNSLVSDFTWTFRTLPPSPPKTYTITASAGSNGSINPSGTVTVNEGASQSFTMTPKTGYHVADVLVDGTSVGPMTSYTFNNVTANHTIKASFAINTFTITATAGEGGKITCTPSTVNYGSSSSCKISPNHDYSIDDVVVDGSSVGAVSSYTFKNVTDDHTISASFRKRELLIF